MKEKTLEGIITKGIGGFYYVKTEEGIIESKARGVFREDNLTPVIGDKVTIRISEEDETGYILNIKDRSSQLVRPSVANVTKAIIVMSIKKPAINTWLLDKFLLMAEYEGLDLLICLNKVDLDEDKSKKLEKIYKDAGYNVLLTSAKENIGIKELREELKDNISVFAGPSGAGKSSLLNKVSPGLDLEIGDVSSKTERGKHTTRHVELMDLGENSYVVDTPGFSSLKLDFIEDESEVRHYFREIDEYSANCKFNSCLHDKEPGCGVKAAVEVDEINKERYKNYLLLLEEVKNIRRY